MSSTDKKYSFGNFQINTDEQKLLRKGKPVQLEDKAFQLLLLLVENAGKIVEKEKILNTIWADTFVGDNNLTVALSKIRRALKDNAKKPVFIETVSRKGLRFIANVVEENDKNSNILDQPLLVIKQEQKLFVSAPQINYISDNHSAQVITGSVIYGALFAIALLLEISYEFSRYGNQALWLSLPTAGFACAATCASLTYTEQLTRRNEPQGYFLGIIFFTGICFFSWLILNPFLPDFAITRANGIQTQAASTAFLKNTMIYFWALGVLFLLTPFYMIIKLQDKIRRQEDFAIWRILIFLYAVSIVIFWILVLIFALKSTFFLFDRLDNRSSRIFFEIFAWMRFWIWFVLSLASLIWFISFAGRLIENKRTELLPSLKNTDKILRIRLVSSITVLLLSLSFIWIISSAKQIPPKLSHIKVITPANANQEFFVDFYGEDFESDLVCIRVIGDGCPELQPCEVPNSALKKHSSITENQILNVPLTLSKGEFYIFAQNGSSPLSNSINLVVP